MMERGMDAQNDVTLDGIKVLRERTGAGVVDCKTALKAAGGDIEEAIKILRERGKIKAAKKAEHAAGEGALGVYVHTNKKVAALVAIRCETDFVARSGPFEEFVKDLAMHVVAMDPLAVRPEDLPTDLADQALLTQPFVKNPDITVGDLVVEKVVELGENIVVEKFTRMVL